MHAALQAIADSRRRRILELVRDGKLSSGEIASHFRVTRPAISQHLKILERVGLVRVHREGTRRLYELRPEGITELHAFLAQLWGDGLQRLRQVAEDEEKRRKPHATRRRRHRD